MAERKSDFDKDALAQTTEQHGKDISELADRVSVLENTLKPAQLALLLDSAADDSKKLDKLFSRLFCDMMEKDENVKTSIATHIGKVDRSVIKRFWGKIGFATWSVVIFILGIVATAVIKKFIR